MTHMYEEFVNHSIAVYAGYLKDKSVLTCTSGGVATALSIQFIEEGGYVAGVRYKKDFSGAEYIITNKVQELNQLKESKYIDSDMNNVYMKVKNLLDEGNKVLFIGLPCKVGGLYYYLKNKYDNLLTCELICHGPTYTEVHKQYINFLENKFHSKIVDFSVRRKKDCWIPSYIYAEFENNKKYYKQFNKTPYAVAFNVYGKERCYNCQYKGNNRLGDIQIGDYWGIDNKADYYNPMGTSCILVHTNKGNNYLLRNKYLFLSETSFINIVKNNPYIIFQKKKDPNYNKFKNNFEKNGLFYAVRKHLTFKQKIKKIIPKKLKLLIKKLHKNSI